MVDLKAKRLATITDRTRSKSDDTVLSHKITTVSGGMHRASTGHNVKEFNFEVKNFEEIKNIVLETK